ncbi:MAG: porphobilinogen synthase [Anaerolineae bacterium]|nr:porphobilinogen synthase [Anaerolineae bacterium]MCB9108952.1 porphobilinogen synthase [Anaerolineales bacterium]
MNKSVNPRGETLSTIDIAAGFPTVRPRRLRQSEPMRRLVRETRLSPADFIYPLFVVHGRGIRREIVSMPGVFHLSIDRLAAEAEELAQLGIPGVILFGLPAEKDPIGRENFAEDGIVQQAIKALRAAVSDLVIMTDVCMCEYTDHGHCGVIEGHHILNDPTLEILGQVAVSHAAAGADVVAPSAMMDGQVAAIRQALDQAGYIDTPIMGYSAKYASAFYGPFRDAADSPPQFGDRSTYQMDPANQREAMREIALDVSEGADMIMVKPAMAYLDIIRQARDTFPDLPLAAYNVSGEYSMLKAAARLGWLDEKRVALESLLAIKRAGADMILSYWAKDAVRWLDSMR